MDSLDFPLFEEVFVFIAYFFKGWCADEELLLIEGLETYGIGMDFFNV